MYTYMLVLNDYGIRPSTIWFLQGEKAPLPGPNDVYDPTDTDASDGSLYGNTNLTYDASKGWTTDDLDDLKQLGWDLTRNAKTDIRLYYAYNNTRLPEDWTTCRFGKMGDDSYPQFYQESSVSDFPICYSTEALKYAQAAYLVSIVTVQAAGLISAKTRNLSLYQQGMINSMGNFGLFFEFALVAVLLYVQPLNIALGTRQIAFHHFAVPSFSFYIAIFFYDELRKIFLRRGMVREDGRFKQKGWIVQNTYY
uniref:Cation-transporting P-type ATPase C-terminal domain-containing protein n=1 Tax=Strombidium inclinatum TaxID=197538 RepID=A0A7S3IM29_9SPIT|mmetsp:Transcript_27969/g.42292  ORF Transcript_27969/g.42292 Transcript_27969/m.42292 type:complete len:252 (+) Transcript_27969:152-907(+)